MKKIEKQLNSTLICVFKIQRQFYSQESKNNPNQSEISKNFYSPISDRIKFVGHLIKHKSKKSNFQWLIIFITPLTRHILLQLVQ